MLALIGFAVALAFVWRLASYAWALTSKNRSLSHLGPWVVITGATDGIGRGYAIAIAKKNEANLLLIGRNSEKLTAVEQELKCIPGFKHTVKTVKFDFGRKSTNTYDELQIELSNIEVGVLINNAGVSYPSPMYWEMVDDSLIDDIVEVNLRSTMRLSRMVVKDMKARGRGAIVCIGSGAAEIGEPMTAGYVGVKGGVASFCRSLQAELVDRNILVQCQIPLFVATKMSKIRNSSITVPSPEQYAEAGLKMIEGARVSGIMRTPVVVSPFPIHFAILEVVSWLPQDLVQKFRLQHQQVKHKKYLEKINS